MNADGTGWIRMPGMWFIVARNRANAARCSGRIAPGAGNSQRAHDLKQVDCLPLGAYSDGALKSPGARLPDVTRSLPSHQGVVLARTARGR
jgi:hypothetical protein